MLRGMKMKWIRCESMWMRCEKPHSRLPRSQRVVQRRFKVNDPRLPGASDRSNRMNGGSRELRPVRIEWTEAAGSFGPFESNEREQPGGGPWINHDYSNVSKTGR